MTIGSRLRGRGPRGLSRFLGEHQRCGAGFDVGRPDGPGTGKLTVTCAGCGERFLYESALGAAIPAGSALPASSVGPAAGEVAEHRPVEAAKAARRREPGDWYWEGSSPLTERVRPGSLGQLARDRTDKEPARETLVTEPPVEAEREAGGEPPSDRPGLPPSLNGAGWRRLSLPRWWVDAIIVAAMLGAVAIIVLGATSDEDGSSDEAGAPAPTQAEQPAPAPQPGSGEPSGSAGAGGAADVELGRPREFLSLYAISLPRSWDSGRDGAVVRFTSNDDDAGMRVFYELGSDSLEGVRGKMSSFLKREHADAEIGDLQSDRIGGHDAVSLRSTYRGGEQTATLISAPPYGYLLVTSLAESASPTRRAEAEAVTNSFRAL